MSATDPLLLGIDGGGTTTEAWLALPGGRVVGRGRAGPSNAKAVGPEAARRALDDAIAAAFADAGATLAPVASACLGLAGFDRPEDWQLLSAWVHDARWADRFVLVNDGDLVIAAGTPEGSGIGVIAGTGSIAVGRTSDARKARAGGWGHLIGDEGSAYAVVLAALRMVARRADGRDPPRDGGDPLAERLCRALGVETPSRIVSTLYAPGFDRTRIAALAPEVLAAVADAPEIVDLILIPAGSALAEQASAVARALDWGPGVLPLAMAGGFLLAAAPVARALRDGLTTSGYDVVATVVPEPVRGAVVLAEQALTTPIG